MSNVVKHGTMNTRVKARPLNQEERAAIELERKAKSPPESVPDGYERGTDQTQLVPGAPVLFGSVGQWRPGVVVELSSPQMVRVKPDDSDQIRSLRRRTGSPCRGKR